MFDTLALQLPSPLQPWQHPLFDRCQVEVWVKRDDLIHPWLSGNKFRKLQYQLIEARQQQANTLLTFGGAHSNHIRAVAGAGKLLNFNTIGVIRGEELGPHSSPTLRFAQACGMQLHFVSRTAYRHKPQLAEEFGSDHWLIPEGGSHVGALPGVAHVWDELAEQLPTPPSHLLTAVGTGGTVAGLLSVATQTKIIGVAVLASGDFLRQEVSQLLGHRAVNWTLLTDYALGGYAKCPAILKNYLSDFQRDNISIPLEPVYTGKVFFAFFDLLKKGFFPPGSRVVLLHTGGIFEEKVVTLN
jgi:1-aminocyclopropane-1-carboxylate deaminase